MAEFLRISPRSSHGYANGEPIPKVIAIPLRLMYAIVKKAIAPHPVTDNRPRRARYGG